MQTDFLILGQGICGTFMSRALMQEGFSVMVVDDNRRDASTKAASGLMNPVTGKRLVRTWMAEELIPFAVKEYRALEQELDCSLITECNILDFHSTAAERELFSERMQQEEAYLHLPAEARWQSYFSFHEGIGEIAPCWLIDLHALLQGWRQKLQQQGALLEQRFDWKTCAVTAEGVRYGDISARRMICCDGIGGFDNPYFSLLPYSRNKGEALIVSIPGLPRTHIFKQGFKIVPWKEDLFWVGASFEWTFSDPGPTAVFRRQVEEHLQQWLKLPFTVVEHLAAERPATVGHRPFVGFHPLHSAVGVLSGMGTKGCSVAPFFARQLAHHISKGQELHPEADISRYSRILSR